MTATITPTTGSHSAIMGLGAYRPERVVTNEEICEKIDSTDEWIRTRSGIRSRRFAAPGESSVTMGIEAGRKAIEAAGTDEAQAVVKKMKEMPVNDFFAHGGKVREDGRMVHDMYLVQVKSPEESKYPWDYYKVIRTIPGDQAFRPLNESECPLVKK